MGVTEELQFRMSKLWQTTGKIIEQQREVCFYRGKSGSWGGLFEEFKVVTASHWLSVAVTHWLGSNQELNPKKNQLKKLR